MYQCYEGIPFYVKTRDSRLGFCDLDPNSHFFVLLEPTQESNIATSLLQDPNSKLGSRKNTLKNRFF